MATPVPLGLSAEGFNLGWVVTFHSPDGGASTSSYARWNSPVDSAISVHVGDEVEAAYEMGGRARQPRRPAGSTMHSMDIPASPIRPEASGGHPNGGGVALAPTPHTLPWSVLLHLRPGLVVGAAYLALIPAARALGLPSAAAIGAQAILVTGPLMIGILKVSSHRRPGEPTIALRRVPTVRATLGWATLIICAAAAAFVLTRPVRTWLERTLFQAWPDSWKPQLGTAGGYSDSALLWTAFLLLIGSVLIAPVVEEAYFRGYLLPRMPARLGRTTPLAHTVLFAFYHMWTLWLTPTRILAVLPLTYITLRTRSILPAVVAHVVLNLIDVVVIIAFVIRPG